MSCTSTACRCAHCSRLDRKTVSSARHFLPLGRSRGK